MLRIEFKLNLSEKELSQLSLVDFEGEYGSILYGQFEIKVNEQRYGLYDPEAPSQISDFFEAPIIAWLGLLNEVVTMKQDHPYAAVNAIDDALLWLEFIDQNDNNLQVELIQVDKNFNSKSYIVTERINQVSKCLWKEEIKKQELIDEVKSKTEKLVNIIETINPSMLNSKSIQGLLKRYDTVKSIK